VSNPAKQATMQTIKSALLAMLLAHHALEAILNNVVDVMMATY